MKIRALEVTVCDLKPAPLPPGEQYGASCCAAARVTTPFHPDQAKARRAIAVPLNDTAMQVVRSQVGKHPVRVFTYEGKPARQVSTAAWYKALARAGVGDFCWHDLRHTWASWHVQGGTPLFALQELAGWETEKMVRRYAHLAAEHLAVYAANTESHGTNTAQQPDFRGTARLQVVKS